MMFDLHQDFNLKIQHLVCYVFSLEHLSDLVSSDII